jgi:hypothetical protein
MAKRVKYEAELEAAKRKKGKLIKTKKELIYDILKRWWYCLPDWPPVGYDYAPLLLERKLRVVKAISWKIEDEFDKDCKFFCFLGLMFFRNEKG